MMLSRHSAIILLIALTIIGLIINLKQINVANFEQDMEPEPNMDYVELSEDEYLVKLLFNESSILEDYFLNSTNLSSLTDYIPLRIDYFRRSRIVVGDTTSVRKLLYNVYIEKKCISGLVIGGSVTVGIPYPNERWTNHLNIWLSHYFPKCDNGIHFVDNHAIRATSSTGLYYRLWEIFGAQQWRNYLCSKYNLFIAETSSTGGVPDNPADIYTEIIIRNLLLCKDNVPTIIYLQSVQNEEIIMRTSRLATDEEKRLHLTGNHLDGATRELPVLHHYQIPTVSLGAIIYPLAWRYHFNFHLKETLEEYVNLGDYFNDYLNNTVSDIDHIDEFVDDYDDERYNFDIYAHHLRADGVHPTISGQKWLSILISYLLIDEWNNMQTDMTYMRNSVHQELFQNKLWLSPYLKSLPPLLLIDPYKKEHQYYMFLANNRPLLLGGIQFDWEARELRVTLGKYMIENVGWSLKVEKKDKQGLMCTQPGGYFTLRMDISNEESSVGSIFFVMTYLVSYQNMGIANVWIDNKKRLDILDLLTHKVDNIQTIDGLHDIKNSVNNVIYWKIPQKYITAQKHLYLHAKLQETERKMNKFKIINFLLHLE